MTLFIKSEKAKLSQPPLQALIDSATDFVANQVSQAKDYGKSANCYDMPFRYDVGEGIEITIWYALHPFTWEQLATIMRGLQLYILDGKRFRAYGFGIEGLENLDGHPFLGWGDIGPPR